MVANIGDLDEVAAILRDRDVQPCLEIMVCIDGQCLSELRLARESLHANLGLIKALSIQLVEESATS